MTTSRFIASLWPCKYVISRFACPGNQENSAGIVVGSPMLGKVRGKAAPGPPGQRLGMRLKTQTWKTLNVNKCHMTISVREYASVIKKNKVLWQPQCQVMS